MNAKIMNRSELIYHIIAIVTLATIIFLFWNFSAEDPHVEGEIISDLAVDDTASLIDRYLYGMISILCGAILFSIVIALYLEEWLTQTTWQYRIIERFIVILAKVPSLVYGIFAVYFTVLHSQKVLNYPLLLTAILLVMPVTIRSTQTAIQSVDISVREAAYALGATKLRVIADNVLPNAFPLIVAGICTAISRILTIAALIVIISNWINPPNIFTIPKSAVVLISSAMIASIFSSILDYKQLT